VLHLIHEPVTARLSVRRLHRTVAQRRRTPRVRRPGSRRGTPRAAAMQTSGLPLAVDQRGKPRSKTPATFCSSISASRCYLQGGRRRARESHDAPAPVRSIAVPQGNTRTVEARIHSLPTIQ